MALETMKTMIPVESRGVLGLAHECFKCHGTDASQREAKLRLDNSLIVNFDRSDANRVIAISLTQGSRGADGPSDGRSSG